MDQLNLVSLYQFVDKLYLISLIPFTQSLFNPISFHVSLSISHINNFILSIEYPSNSSLKRMFF